MLTDGASADTIELVRRLLSVARRRLGMNLACLSGFHEGFETIQVLDGNTSLFGVHEGQTFDLSETYSMRVIRGDLPGVIADSTGHPVAHGLHVTKAIGVGSYAGVPIENESGDVLGMLCCISRSSSMQLSAADTQILEMTADLVIELLSGHSPSGRRHDETRKRVEAALQQRSFHPVYQPIVSIGAGELIGVEALTRFRGDPPRPDLWFGDAASVGLGAELELAAISAALDRMSDLPAGTFVSVNASPEVIADARLVRALLDHDPKRIVIELTEHVAIGDYRRLVAALQELRGLGVRIAIDDVGAGFASFSHVLELSPHLLKMDMGITRGIDRDPARQAIATGVVELAASLGAQVVAEGVETIEEYAAVGSVGINAAQGFLLGRPEPLPLKVSSVFFEKTAELGRGQTRTGEHFELAMQHSPIGMCLVDLEGSFIHVNPTLAAMLRYGPTELMGHTFQELTHPEDLDLDLALLEECLHGARNSYRMEKRYFRSDGSIVWADLAVILVRSADGSPEFFISQLVDITERRAREELLASKASTDRLTGLPNRAAGERHMARLASNKVPFGVLLCELTDLEGVNQRWGHGAGDAVLDEAARRFSSVVRSKDLVSRWGGHEFMVVVGDSQPGELLDVAERVHAVSVDPVVLEDGTAVTHPLPALGIAHHAPAKEASVDEVIHEADRNMCEDRGRKRITSSAGREGPS